MLTNAHDNNDSYHYQILAMLWSPYWDPTDIILLNAHNILKVSLIPLLMQQMKLKKKNPKKQKTELPKFTWLGSLRGEMQFQSPYSFQNPGLI